MIIVFFMVCLGYGFGDSVVTCGVWGVFPLGAFGIAPGVGEMAKVVK